MKLSDKDRELGEAQVEIKALRLSERVREKVVEEIAKAIISKCIWASSILEETWLLHGMCYFQSRDLIANRIETVMGAQHCETFDLSRLRILGCFHDFFLRKSIMSKFLEKIDGLYMMEVDRVLRPGGYWVLSGPPINWKVNYKGWQRTKKDLEAKRNKIKEIAELLCWEKVSEKGETAIWRKRVQEDEGMCYASSRCRKSQSSSGGSIKPFPSRLNAIPPRIANGLIPGVSSQAYEKDNKMWKKHVKAYINVNKYLLTGRYRNIMDMNACFGGFAGAIESQKSWVMNVVHNVVNGI
ncbi:hypothetical protein ACQ4PT_067386 [Festuca glaucescens]